MRESKIINKEIGIEVNLKYTNADSFVKKTLQKMIDFITNKVKEKVEEIDYRRNNKIECFYIDGLILEIEEWYLLYNGHKLERALIEAFPGLNEFKKNKEYALKNRIIQTVLYEFPCFIPQDLVESFLFIQNQ